MFLAGTPGTLPVGVAQDPFVGPVRGVSGGHKPGVGYRQVWSGKKAVCSVCGGDLRRRLYSGYTSFRASDI